MSGTCESYFAAPEWIDGISVAPDGTLVGQSQATTFGAKQIYRFSAIGAVISKVSLGGVGSLGGLSYAPIGRIYGAGIAGINDVRWFELNPTSGVATSIAAGNQLALSEVCVDGSGVAYGHSFGVLFRYTAATGALLGALTMQRDLGLGAIVCR